VIIKLICLQRGLWLRIFLLDRVFFAGSWCFFYLFPDTKNVSGLHFYIDGAGAGFASLTLLLFYWHSKD
jgi:hypothetical protein